MPSPSWSRRALSRRTAMLGAVALGTTGCTAYSLGSDRRLEGRPQGPSSAPTPEGDPDIALAAAVLADEQELVDRIDATTSTHPDLTGLLQETRAVHAAHVALLADAVPDDARTGSTPSPSASPTTPSPSASGSSGPAASGAATTGPFRVPQDPLRALRALARNEDALVLADKRSAFAAQSGAFARVLATMAAAAAQQSAALRSAEIPGSNR